MDIYCRCVGCNEYKQTRRKQYTRSCKSNHTFMLCTTCSTRILECPECALKMTMSTTCCYCKKNSGVRSLNCINKHVICNECYSKSTTNSTCRICVQKKQPCSNCNSEANSGRTKMKCGLHELCPACRDASRECIACRKVASLNCAMCTNKGCTALYEVFKCNHGVCRSCLNTLNHNALKVTCTQCRKELDKSKLDALVKPNVVEICRPCGKLKGLCDCISVPSPIKPNTLVSEPKVQSDKLSSSQVSRPMQTSSKIPKEKASELPNGPESKKCEICSTIIQGKLLEGMCKFCYYEYRVKE